MSKEINLNEDQKRIVRAPMGAILVKAAAGTGKTRVLTERIVHLINEHNINPEEILAITFTNKAANEMKERIQARIKNHYKIPDSIGTIHSAFNQVLRFHIRKIDKRNSNYQIVDEDEQYGLICQALRAVKCAIPLNSSQYSDIQQEFSHFKKLFYEGKEPENKTKLYAAWQEYELQMEIKNRLDFDDILILSKKLFQEYPNIRREFKNKFRTVFIDEIQDLNDIQWDVIKAILEDGYTNFMGIGDPNQSIYLYDGALENIFLEIKNFFSQVQEYNLKTNYRSGKEIINLSNEVKNHDYGTVVASRSHPGKIETFTSQEKAINTILSDRNLSEWAILYYTNYEGENMAKLLIENSIPLKINKFKLFSRKIIKQTIMLLKIAFFENFQPLKELIWSSQFKISKKAKMLLSRTDEMENETLKANILQHKKWIDFEISNSDKVKINSLVSFINNLSEMKKSNLLPMIDECIDFLKNEWDMEETKDSPTEENLATFKKWIDMMQFKNLTVEAAQKLIMNLDKYAEGYQDIHESSVTLSTIHSSKGLEWNKVLILRYPNLEDSFEAKGINKNLAYVAVTRAREILFLDKLSSEEEENYE